MPSIDDWKKAGGILKGELSASIRIHTTKHPKDSEFETRAPCFRITLRALDPNTKSVEAGPMWKDISADASADESTFVIKAEKIASLGARLFKGRKPRKLELEIVGVPLPAWAEMYEPLKRTETIAAGDITTVRLQFEPQRASGQIPPGGGEPPKANKFIV